MIREKELRSLPGWPVVVLLLAVLVLAARGVIGGIAVDAARPALVWAGVLVLDVFLMFGLFVVNPNEAKVVQVFGTYVGSEKRQGFRWTIPIALRRRISLRVRNFETAKLKVNDHIGTPIEIAAVVVWQVVDSAEAVFQVDSYENFVHVQSEAALRNLATSYPYDAHVEGEVALRSHTGEVAEQLQKEIQERLARAGVQVIEARISHLAYAPEIASAMLQRQQASAVVAARTKIVEGAVGMVEMALDKLREKEVVTLDEERKAAMVSNLLVILCSDRHAQPVVNTGTLYP